MAKNYNKRYSYVVIDSENKVYTKYRLKGLALSQLPKLKKKYLRRDLEIIKREVYEKLE